MSLENSQTSEGAKIVIAGYSFSTFVQNDDQFGCGDIFWSLAADISQGIVQRVENEPNDGDEVWFPIDIGSFSQDEVVIY